MKKTLLDTFIYFITFYIQILTSTNLGQRECAVPRRALNRTSLLTVCDVRDNAQLYLQTEYGCLYNRVYYKSILRLQKMDEDVKSPAFSFDNRA